jgi:hypothetical protein
MSDVGGFLVYKKAPIEDVNPKNKRKNKKDINDKKQQQSNEKDFLTDVKEIFPDMDDKIILSVLEKTGFSVEKAVEFLTTYGEKEMKAQGKGFSKTPCPKEEKSTFKPTPNKFPKVPIGESINLEDENDDYQSIIMEYEQSIYEENEDREEYDSVEFNRIFNDLLKEFEKENGVGDAGGSQIEKNKDLLKLCGEEICWWLKVQPA